MLATGGCGKVYRYTSNPDIATGDGLAMAYRAGCRLSDLEFMQFHPTCLYHPGAKNFLISEAVRGEGGILTTIAGDPVMDTHPMKELAPRDVVARAIDREMKRRGDHYVLLHIEHLDADRIRSRFPVIHETCLRFGIDITREPMPGRPGGALYVRRGGGGRAWADRSARSLCRGGGGLDGFARREPAGEQLPPGGGLLWDAGGAGRRRPAASIARRPQPAPAWEVGKASLPKESVLVDAHWDLVRRLMWDFVGIVRTDHRLELASRYLEILRRSIESYYWDFVLDTDLVELRNVALVAELIVRSARMRPESRGLHYNEDHPDDRPASAKDTILQLDEPIEG